MKEILKIHNWNIVIFNHDVDDIGGEIENRLYEILFEN